MNLQTQIHFSPFRLDTANELLWRGTERLGLRPKTFSLLRYFLQHPGQLLTRDRLLDACWPDTAVTDTVLKVCVREIREMLGDDPQNPRYIETAHRRGYRFIGQIAQEEHGIRNDPHNSVTKEEHSPQIQTASGASAQNEEQVIFLKSETGSGAPTIIELRLHLVTGTNGNTVQYHLPAA